MKSIRHDWWQQYCEHYDKVCEPRDAAKRQLTIAAMEAGPNLEEPKLLSLLDNTTDVEEFRDKSTGLPELEMQMHGRAEGA